MVSESVWTQNVRDTPAVLLTLAKLCCTETDTRKVRRSEVTEMKSGGLAGSNPSLPQQYWYKLGLEIGYKGLGANNLRITTITAKLLSI